MAPRYVCFVYKPRELYLKKTQCFRRFPTKVPLPTSTPWMRVLSPHLFCDNVRTGQSHWRRRRRGVFWGWLSGRETWQWKIHWSIAVSIAVFDYQRLLIILSSKKIGESRRPQKIRIEIEHHETWVDPSSRNPRSAWISLTVLVCLALCLPSIKNKAFERNTMRPTI